MENIVKSLNSIRHYGNMLKYNRYRVNYLSKLDENNYFGDYPNISDEISFLNYKIKEYSIELENAISRVNPEVKREITIYNSLKHHRDAQSTKRRRYCIHRLYKKNISTDTISTLVNSSGNYIREIVGQAFADQCLKTSCWAKPFLSLKP